MVDVKTIVDHRNDELRGSQVTQAAPGSFYFGVSAGLKPEFRDVGDEALVVQVPVVGE